jgi:hypothetical protein
MVIAPAKTGKERSNSNTVIKTDQTNRGIRSKDMLGLRMLIIVDIKLIAPRIEDAPAK